MSAYPVLAKAARMAARPINAMAKTVATKPAFRESFKPRPCLVARIEAYRELASGPV
jgi:putative SOS response-associated peptidase YedK